MSASSRTAAPLAWLMCAACSGGSPAVPPSAAKSVEMKLQPLAAGQSYALPTTPFVVPQPWKPTQGKGPAVLPPQAADHTWYVYVEQYEPRQKPTPQWQPLPAAETVEVKMPPGSSLRCIVPPLSIAPEPEESGFSLESWFLAREVLCSGDGFRTFSAHPFRMRLMPDGKRELVERSDGWLRERAADGSIVQTQVSLRPEAPRRDATQGPPQVLTRAK